MRTTAPSSWRRSGRRRAERRLARQLLAAAAKRERQPPRGQQDGERDAQRPELGTAGLLGLGDPIAQARIALAAACPAGGPRGACATVVAMSVRAAAMPAAAAAPTRGPDAHAKRLVGRCALV